MMITADSKQRVGIPRVKPGGKKFTCEQQDKNHLGLSRLNPPPKKMTAAKVCHALKNSKLKFETSWDELRGQTRKP
jgi:hypothetical protein